MPALDDLGPERHECAAVRRHRVVVEVATYDMPQPLPLERRSAGAYPPYRDADCGQLPFASGMWPERHTQGLSSRQYGTHNCRRRCRSVETRLGAYMIRSLCTFLVLSCVAGLSGVLTGHLWNRYADENGLLRVSGIYERIRAAGVGFVDVAQGYWPPPAPRDRLLREASAFQE
jgi:hypothetical protein